MRMKWTRHRWRPAPWMVRSAAAPSPAWASAITRRTPVSPRARSEPKKLCQNPSLSLSPMSHPRTSRLPSVVTPVATTIAIETTWETLLRTLR